MLLAELEVFHSRPFSPTRRLALGRRNLPVSPPPGFGGILLGGIAAVAGDEIDPDLRPDLHRLTIQLEAGQRVVQPRLRNRFQIDHVGLARTRALLLGDGEQMTYDFDGNGSPFQMLAGRRLRRRPARRRRSPRCVRRHPHRHPVAG